MDKKQTRALRKRFTERFYLNNRPALIIAIFSTLLAALLNLAISWLMQIIVDFAAGNDTGFTITSLVLLSVLLVGGILAVSGIDWYFRPRFLKKAMRQYKDFVFDELSKKSVNSFSGENTSTYISALSNDVNSIELNYLSKLFPFIQQVVMFVGAFALMLYYSPMLTIAAVLLSFAPVVASLIAGNRLAVQEKAVSDRNESFLGALKDMLTGFSVIKSFKAEHEAMRMFAKSNASVEDAKCKRRRTELLITAIGEAAGFIAQFGVFLFGAYLAITGRGVTAGIVIVFVQLMNFVITPISSVPQIIANRKAATALIDKLATAIYTNIDKPGRAVDSRLDDAIELRELSFSYDGETRVLDGINLRFEAGKSYALVGGSGSGKTTLLNLLMRSRDDYEGSILFDGDELREIASSSLYDLVSIVQQNVFVFNSSVKDNITMFREFDGALLERAVNSAGLAPFMEERGGEFLCGENGSALSGGERQRISIARGILHGASVMLVDEATAALDAETAHAVSSSILDIEGITRIIVTHRLESSLLERYDKILVLKDGKIRESGRFDELMAMKGYFYSLFTVSQ